LSPRASVVVALLAPSAPVVPAAAVNVTRDIVTCGDAFTNAAMLDGAAVVPATASNSRSAIAIADDTLSMSSAYPTSLGRTFGLFVVAYDQSAQAKPPYRLTAEVIFTCSAYVPAQMYTLAFDALAAFAKAAPIVFSGASFVPAFESAPPDETKIPDESFTHEGSFDGSQFGAPSTSLPSPPPPSANGPTSGSEPGQPPSNVTPNPADPVKNNQASFVRDFIITSN
jgi:hypothetical protein